MREPYIILRTDPVPQSRLPANTTGFRSGSAGSEPPRRLEFATDELDTKQAADLARDPSFTVAPVMPVRLIAPVAVVRLPDDIDAPEPVLWGLEAIGATKSPFTGAGITVGLLDTGVDSTHPAFSGIHLEEHDFTGEGPGDLNGHGTHCAGTFFGRSVGGTRVGVAPGIAYAFVAKVLDASGAGNIAGIMRGIAWCVENGASIISMSLGLDFAGRVAQLNNAGLPLDLATSHALRSYHQTVVLFERYASLLEARTTIGAGSLLVAAAGNESKCNQHPQYRLWASPPASAPSVIAVAAVDRPAPGTQEHPLAPFSNWGADLASPGVGIVSAAAGGGLCQMDGTSMATPHVAGIAALWAQKLLLTDALHTDRLRQRLLGSGQPERLAPDVRNELGAGLANAPMR